jgi:hypothetical protein
MSESDDDLKQDQELNRDAKFIFLSIFWMLALNIPADLYALGWKSAAFNTCLTLVVFGLYSLRYKKSYLPRWLAFGFAAGVTELAADWWLVNSTKSLVYPVDEPMLVVSPLYMPLAWTVVLLQGGVIAQWLASRMAPYKAALLSALLCSVNIPLYEHLAKDANWWYYRDTPMVFNAPYYIIVGEFLIGLPLVWMALHLAKRKALVGSLSLGVLQGVVIFIAYVIAWWLVGPCTGSVVQFPCG